MVTISYKAMNFFFDRPVVKKAMDRTTRIVLRTAGSYIRRTAKKKAGRKSRRSALPFRPPKRHSEIGLTLIFYAYDLDRENVVIGPVAFNRKVIGKSIPQLMEEGGIVPGFPESELVPAKDSKKRDWRRTGRRVVAKYSPHPFMGPSMEEEAPKFPSLYARVFPG